MNFPQYLNSTHSITPINKLEASLYSKTSLVRTRLIRSLFNTNSGQKTTHTPYNIVQILVSQKFKN